jgi:uncharacterized protein (TIGR00290 family)
MKQPIKAYMNWSGGKDSSLCLQRMLRDKAYSVDCLLTNINSVHDRVSMHGVRRVLLEEQCRSIGIALKTVELPEMPGMQDYERLMQEAVVSLKQEGYTTAIFGDIFLEDLRKYRESKLAGAGVQTLFPLWAVPTRQLMEEFLASGFRAVVVCVNEQYLSADFCGRLIDESFVRDLPANVDICGENGEYHSFVFDGPVFRYPVPFQKGEVVRRTYPVPKNAGDACTLSVQEAEYGFHFCDLLM